MQHGEFCPGLGGDLNGEEIPKEGLRAYVPLVHFGVQQKPTEHRKVTIP